MPEKIKIYFVKNGTRKIKSYMYVWCFDASSITVKNWNLSNNRVATPSLNVQIIRLDSHKVILFAFLHNITHTGMTCNEI